MRKILAAGSMLVAGAFAHSHETTITHNHAQANMNVAAWPKENLYNSFTADLTLHTVAGGKLIPIDNI